MQTVKKISVRQLCFIIITLFSVSKFYVLPATVSGVSHEAGFISVAINFFMDFLLLLACVFVIKLKEKPLYETSIEIFGAPLTKFVYVLYAVYFISKTFIPLLEQKNTISLTFYESQPTLLIFMPFFVLAFFITAKGVNAFSRSVEIMIWIFFTALLIIFSLSIPAGKYSSLLPLSQPISKIAKGAHSTLIWFGDPVCILFLGDYLSSKKGLLKKTTISYIISAVLTIALIVVFYAIFSSIAERQYYAPIKMSKYSITLSNIGRLDYLGSVMFSAISVYNVCLPLLLACVCMNKVFNLKSENLLFPTVITIILAVALFIFQNEIFKHILFVQTYLLPFFLVMAYLLPLIMLLAVLLKKQRRIYVQTR